MSKAYRWTTTARQAFLEALQKTGNVSEAARRVNLSRRHAYKLKQDDPDFRQAWQDALDAAVDTLEMEARRRAIEGYEKPIFYQGKKIGVERKYSDGLLTFLLRAHRPSVYREDLGDKSSTERMDIHDLQSLRTELSRRLAGLASGNDLAEFPEGLKS